MPSVSLTSISFTPYEQPIWISNFCNKFLFTYFVSKYWQDKSFKLRPKYIKKCQYIHYNTLQHLLGKLKFGIRKIGCSMSWTRYKFLISQKDCHKWFGTDINSQKNHNLVRPGCEQPPFDLLNVHQQRARWLPVCPTCFGHLKSH